MADAFLHNRIILSAGADLWLCSNHIFKIFFVGLSPAYQKKFPFYKMNKEMLLHEILRKVEINGIDIVLVNAVIDFP